MENIEKPSTSRNREHGEKEEMDAKTEGYKVVDFDDGNANLAVPDELIIQEEDVIDNQLEETSKKVRLTAKNVRSILHEVITNEQVLDMVRNTLQQDGIEEKLKEAIFEPKMTRSKVKEVIEKGEVMPNWNLPSLKTFSDPLKIPNFLEISFSDNDDENDDEYKPNPNELTYASDDDETNASSVGSDFGSPCPLSVPATPLSVERDTLCSTPNHCMTQSIKEDQTIARRTRSKLPLKDTPLEAIESTFVAPDITPDMYNTQCDNADWREFLSELMKTNNTTETNEDDNDPEYNFFAEAEKEEVDEEDYRNDKAVKVSKKELNELMDELFEAYGLEDEDDDSHQGHSCQVDSVTVEADTTKTKNDSLFPDQESPSSTEGDKQTEYNATEKIKTNTSSLCPVFIPPLQIDGPLVHVLVSDIMKAGEQFNQQIHSDVSDECKVPELSGDERAQIKDQMRKHIQLLAQTFMQSSRYKDNSEMEMAARMAKLFLVELKALGDKSNLPCNTKSMFHEVNLEGALAVTDMDFSVHDEIKQEILLEEVQSRSVKDSPLCDNCFTFEQMEAMVTNKIFLFPQMIPETAFQLNPPPRDRTRVCFTESEDNLLAIGLGQFGHLPKKYILIHEFMLPTKKRIQLKNRVKNLKAHRYENNAVKAYYSTNKLPVFPRYTEIEDEFQIVPPIERDPELLPGWWVPFFEAKKRTESRPGTITNLTGQFNETWNMHSARVTNDTCSLGPSTMPFFTSKNMSSTKLTEIVTGSNVSETKVQHQNSVSKSDVHCSPRTPAPSVEMIHECSGENDDDDTRTGHSKCTQHMPETSSGHFLAMPFMPPIRPNSSRTLDLQNIQPLAVAKSDMGDVYVQNPRQEPHVPLTSEACEIDKRHHHADKIKTSITITNQSVVQMKLLTRSSSPIILPSSPGFGASGLQNFTVSSAGSPVTVPACDFPDGVSSNAPCMSDDMVHKEGESLDNTDQNKILQSRSSSPIVTSSCEGEMPTWVNLLSTSQPSSPGVFTPVVFSNNVLKDNQSEMETSISESPVQTVFSPSKSSHISDVTKTTTVHGGYLSSPGRPQNLLFMSPVKTFGLTQDTSFSSDSNSCSDVIMPPREDGNSVEQSFTPILPCTPEKQASSDEKAISQAMKDLNSLNSHHAYIPRAFHGRSPRKHKSPRKRLILSPKRHIMPKPFSSPRKSVNPFLQKSPKRQALQHKARAILPKGMVIKCYTSPVKTSAAAITAKAKQVATRKQRAKPSVVRKLSSILPKTNSNYYQQAARDCGTGITNPSSVIVSREALERAFRENCSKGGVMQDNSKLAIDFENIYDEVETDHGQEDQTDESEVDEDDEGDEDVDTDDDEMEEEEEEDMEEEETNTDDGHLQALMAASTTIQNGSSKLETAKDDQRLTKGLQRQQDLLNALAPDIVENDPLRDERDTAFAQAFLYKARLVLGKEKETYEKLLTVLLEFGRSEKNPVQLHHEITVVLKDYPELVEEFAGFLLPDQAKECGCFMENHFINKAKVFLRKCEIHLKKKPSHLLKFLKALSNWNQWHLGDLKKLLGIVQPILCGYPHLMEELTSFFPEEAPPAQYFTDFEEVDLSNNLELENHFPDSFEEINVGHLL